MNVNYKIVGIENEYNHLFKLSDEELFSKGIIKKRADSKPGYPCRVSLEDAEVGEEVMLFQFIHHNINSPYASSGPIYVRKNAKKVNLKINEIPEMLYQRKQSLRAYSKKGMMVAAINVEKENIKKQIEIFFDNTEISYIQIHNANPGCYNCQVNKIE